MHNAWRFGGIAKDSRTQMFLLGGLAWLLAMPALAATPEGQEITGIEFITPENPEPRELPSTMSEKRVNFAVPEFLVFMRTTP